MKTRSRECMCQNHIVISTVITVIMEWRSASDTPRPRCSSSSTTIYDQDVIIADPSTPALSATMDINTDMEKQPPTSAPFPVQVDWGDHNVWHWKAEDKEKWIPASPVWQKFLDYWIDPIRAVDLHQNTFPHELQIFLSSHFEELESTMTSVGAKPLLTSDGRMLVFERHGFLYHSLKRNREQRYRGGVVLGGQPGIGASGASESLSNIIDRNLRQESSSLVLFGTTSSRSAASFASST